MFTDVDMVGIWLPNLWVKLKETANTARARSQIKSNSPMAYLFTQEINLFELCAARLTALLVACCYFFKNKNGHKRLWFHRRAQRWKPAASCRSEKLKPSSSPICCRFPRGEERCWSWHSLPEPTNKSCFFLFFFPDMLARDLDGKLGKEKKKKRKAKERAGKGEVGETAPGFEGDIVCMCTQAQGLWPAA